MKRNKNIVKKMHYRSYENKNLIGCYRQIVQLNSYYIRALNSFIFSKDQIQNIVSIINKIIKIENKKINKLYSNNVEQSIITSSINLKVHVYPYFSLTLKARESRMGKGKGAIETMYFPVKKGLILFEISNISTSAAQLCFDRIKSKIGCLIRLENINY